jgi:hypothetical protein
MEGVGTMNPTQNQDNTAPEPRPDTSGAAAELTGLLADDKRFRSWIASATRTADQPADQDRYWLTIKGHRYLLWKGITEAEFGALVQEQDAFRALCEKTDADWAEGYGERLIEQYTSHYEAADAREIADLEKPGGEAPTFTCDSCLTTFMVASAEPLCVSCATVSRVLLSAALYLDRHGWIQGGYFDATTGVFTPPACIVGAIAMVCYGGPVDAPAQMFDHPGFADFEQAVLRLDRYLLVENGSESYEFNDAKGRKVEDVIGVLREAATRPEHEMLDALKTINDRNEQIAYLIQGGQSLATDKRCPACTGPLLRLGQTEYWCAAESADVTSYGGDV